MVNTHEPVASTGHDNFHNGCQAGKSDSDPGCGHDRDAAWRRSRVPADSPGPGVTHGRGTVPVAQRASHGGWPVTQA